MPCVMCHMSHAMCHMSHVTCHMSEIYFCLLQFSIFSLLLLQKYSDIYSNLQPFQAFYRNLKPFQSNKFNYHVNSSHLKPFKAKYSHLQPFTEMCSQGMETGIGTREQEAAKQRFCGYLGDAWRMIKHLLTNETTKERGTHLERILLNFC